MVHQLRTFIVAAAGLLCLYPYAYGSPIRMSLEPAPDETASIQAQLKRFKGQTKFLNAARFYAMRNGLPVPEPKAGQADGGARREQQESDIFKLGKPGSKLLYLLNDYRGLQVVSFADGADSPKLLGRAPSTGNWADTMYADLAHDRLIVLERISYDSSGHSAWSRDQSRALVYDVRDPAHPRIAQELALEGEIADSRLVGDILYVATALRPDSSAGGDKDAKGQVYSLDVSGESIRQVEKTQLALPSSRRENMNIVEVQEGEAYRYYLLAVLSESGWGWWDRQSLVEVVDISDAHGRIQPVMVASARGAIRERSQTQIRNHTLLVTSNYWTDAQVPQPSLTRIAVETFKLPDAASEMLSEQEAEYRKLRIEHELGDSKGDDREALRARLVANPEFGIQGRFVRTADGNVRKLMPDSVVTLGDTQGLSASLQDVRYDDGLLYVFWVPSNNHDPLDLLDVSHPENGVKYLRRLQFDGWIERAIPLSHAGKRYIVGLGWVVPAVDNENGRRYPQAMLFEIQGERAQDVAQLTLNDGSVWADFNRADRFVELKDNGDGTGSVMFQAYSFKNGKSADGGKLVGFDLGKESFTEGALLAGNPGWLRRIFTNPEINRINAFSDQSLGGYDVQGVGAGREMVAATGILELARDVVAYVPAGDLGIQIVSAGGWTDGTEARTELRVVGGKDADAELPAVRDRFSVTGYYEAHLVDSRDGSLWVATRSDTGSSVYRVKMGAIQPGKLGLVGSMNFAPPPAAKMAMPCRGCFAPWQPFQLVQLQSGEVLAGAGTDWRRVGDLPSVSAVRLGNCGLEASNGVELKVLDGKPYFFYETQVQDPKHENLMYSRNFLAPLVLDRDGSRCGQAINIPGTPVSIAGSHLVTEDEHVTDVVERTYHAPGGDTTYAYAETARSIESLKLGESESTLADGLELQGYAGWGQSIRSLGRDRFGYLETSQGWGGEQGPAHLVSLGFDDELRITQERFYQAGEFSAWSQLLDVKPDPRVAGGYLGFIAEEKRLTVLRWTDQDRSPRVETSVVVPGYLYSWYGQGSPVSVSSGAVQISMGLYGVEQVGLK